MIDSGSKFLELKLSGSGLVKVFSVASFSTLWADLEMNFSVFSNNFSKKFENSMSLLISSILISCANVSGLIFLARERLNVRFRDAKGACLSFLTKYD